MGPKVGFSVFGSGSDSIGNLAETSPLLTNQFKKAEWRRMYALTEDALNPLSLRAGIAFIALLPSKGCPALVCKAIRPECVRRCGAKKLAFLGVLIEQIIALLRGDVIRSF